MNTPNKIADNDDRVQVRLRLRPTVPFAEARAKVENVARGWSSSLSVALHDAPLVLNVPRPFKLKVMATLAALDIGQVEDMPKTLREYLLLIAEMVDDRNVERVAMCFTTGAEMSFALYSSRPDEGLLELTALFSQGALSAVNLHRRLTSEHG